MFYPALSPSPPPLPPQTHPHLHTGDPSIFGNLEPHPAVNEAVKAVLDSKDVNTTGYPHSSGLEVARRAIADSMSTERFKFSCEVRTEYQLTLRTCIDTTRTLFFFFICNDKTCNTCIIYTLCLFCTCHLHTIGMSINCMLLATFLK